MVIHTARQLIRPVGKEWFRTLYAFNQPMGFPVLVANAFAIARFNLDGKLIVIPPAGGWSTTTDRTAIEVQITYF